jgi:hypothetical protein
MGALRPGQDQIPHRGIADNMDIAIGSLSVEQEETSQGR